MGKKPPPPPPPPTSGPYTWGSGPKRYGIIKRIIKAIQEKKSQ